MASSPKTPEKTAQEAALERRQSMILDDEIEETEERLKLIARGKLGRNSLLTGAPANRAQAASRGSRGGGASIFGGNSTGASAGSGAAGSSGGQSSGGGRQGGGGGVVK